MNPIEELKKQASSVGSIKEFLERYPNVIEEPGINWCFLHQVTEDQLIVLKDFFNKNGIRYCIYEKTVGIEGDPSNVLQIRKHLFDEMLYPGVKEKERLIEQIEYLQKNHSMTTPFMEEDYPIILKKLRDLPDKEDIEGYSLRYHY